MKCLIDPNCPCDVPFKDMFNHLAVEHHLYVKNGNYKQICEMMLLRLEEHEEEIEDLTERLNRAGIKETYEY